MSGFSSSILNIATSGLATQQAQLAATSNNIANVNTEGYSRRRVDVAERSSAGGSLSFGQGVEVQSVRRVYDEFLEGVVRRSNSEKFAAETEESFLQRAEGILSIAGDQDTIGTQLEEFYTSLSDLTLNPASPELRAGVLQKADSLVQTINTTFNYFANLQNEANERLNQEVSTVNDLVAQIAELNGQVRANENENTEASAIRDKRDSILQKLAEKIDYSVVEDNLGQVNIYLPTGFSLVSGVTSYSLSVTNTPSFSAGNNTQLLNGGPLSFIVYDHDPGVGNQHTDLTSTIAEGGGVIGGLLSARGVSTGNTSSPFSAKGGLVDLASRVEGITRALLTEFNQVYLGVDPENLVSNGGNPLTNDEDPVASATTFSPSSGYFDDATQSSVAPSGVFSFFKVDGLTDSATGSISGLPDLQDLSDQESTFSTYAGKLSLAITNPLQIANGRDLVATEGQLEIQPGDSANIKKLVELRDHKFNLTVGNYNLNTTLSQAYLGLVNETGNLVSSATSSKQLGESKLLAAKERRDSYSGVSLDEEFTNLIKFQRNFEASARMIRVADQLLEEIINLI
jgi:flagellar hook-associated protein 1